MLENSVLLTRYQNRVFLFEKFHFQAIKQDGGKIMVRNMNFFLKSGKSFLNNQQNRLIFAESIFCLKTVILKRIFICDEKDIADCSGTLPGAEPG